MAAYRTVEWMKRISQKGCNIGIIHTNHPVGNSPEFMTLDNSLNHDIQGNLSLHYAVTAHLPDDDSRKFSMRIPSTIVEGIGKIWRWRRIFQNLSELCRIAIKRSMYLVPCTLLVV